MEDSSTRCQVSASPSSPRLHLLVLSVGSRSLQHHRGEPCLQLTVSEAASVNQAASDNGLRAGVSTFGDLFISGNSQENKPGLQATWIHVPAWLPSDDALCRGYFTQCL